MPERIFTASERKAVEAQAHRRGFETLRDYMRTLIETDAAEHGEPPPLKRTHAELRDGIKQGLREALRGEQVPLETLWSDDDE